MRRITHGPMLFRPLVRLPAVIFPHQPVSFALTSNKGEDSAADASAQQSAFQLPKELVEQAWRNHEGRLAVFGPGARIGTEIHLMYDYVLDSPYPTPPDVAHAVGGDQRLRLSRTIRDWREEGGPKMCEVLPLEDETLSAQRLERLEDEADAARTLIERGLEQGSLTLESSALDEEIGGSAVCDPCCHPLFSIQSEQPKGAAELSLWLGARLPLTTSLRVAILSTRCPLRRLQDAVDATRLLLDPQRLERRGHRFKVVVDPPASDQCSTLGGPPQAPRLVVGEAPPNYASWSSDTSFPHG